jgi:hypothetical protein
MKKNLKIFVSIPLLLEIKCDLIAIAYHSKKKGIYTAITRGFIIDGIEKYKAGLSSKERAAYDEIFGNVVIVEGSKPPRKPGNKYVKKKMRGGI